MITDPGLYPSAKRVYVAMLACSSRGGYSAQNRCRAGGTEPLQPLQLSGAIAALMEQGMQRWRRWPNCLPAAEGVCGNEYTIAKRDLSFRYTLIPWSLLTWKLTHAAFLVALYTVRPLAKGRAYPSLRHIRGGFVLLSKSRSAWQCQPSSSGRSFTGTAAASKITPMPATATSLSHRLDRVRSAGSGPFPAHIIANPSWRSRGGGGPIFSKQLVIKKIA